jgi:hypothetical protein
MENNLKHFVTIELPRLINWIRRKQNQGTLTINELKDSCFLFVKLIQVFERSNSKYKQRLILTSLQFLKDLLNLSKAQIDSRKSCSFVQIHSDAELSIKFITEYLSTCSSLPHDLLDYLRLYVFEVTAIFKKLDMDIHACDSFHEALSVFVSRREELKSIFLGLGELPLNEYSQFIKQESADILEFFFDDNIKILTNWNEQVHWVHRISEYCSTHESLGYTRH